MKTNKLNITVDYAKLNATYVFFQFIWQTNDENNTVWANSYHLDQLLTEQKALATLYREGNKAYVMFSRQAISDVERFRQQLTQQAYFFDIRIELIQACQDSNTALSIAEADLYQLLFNALINSRHENSIFNNLNGQLVLFPITKSTKKKNRQYDKDGYHIRVDNDRNLTVLVKNYMRKQDVLGDEKDPKTRANKLAKPAYHIKSGRLVRDFTGNDIEAYIQAGRSNQHAQADALDVKSHNVFSQSRLGVLFNMFNSFNRFYADIAQANFSTITKTSSIDKRFHLLKSDKQFEKLATKLNLKLIDKIKTDDSRALLADIKEQLAELGIKANIIQQEKSDAQHLCLVKPKDYYEIHKTNDLYQQDDRYSRQHLTDEKYREFIKADGKTNSKCKVLLKNLVKELWIKQAVKAKQLQPELLQKTYLINGTWVFGIIGKDDYHLLEIDSKGKMHHIIHDLSDFFPDHPYVNAVELVIKANNPYTNLDISPIEGFVISPQQDVNIILRSEECVIPNLSLIESEIRQNDAKIPAHFATSTALIAILEQCELPLDENWFSFTDALLELHEPIDKEVLRKLINRHYGKGSTNTGLLRQALQDHGIKLGFNKSGADLMAKMGDLLTIQGGMKDDKTAWYSVGYYLESFQHSLPHMVHLREIRTLQGKNIVDKLLPLMDVDFVRYNNYTVLPFPLKYLREMAELIEIEEGVQNSVSGLKTHY